MRKLAGIGQVFTPPVTVEPHPTVEGGYTIVDPRLHGDFRLLFASKERAEGFAINRNLHRERTQK